MRTKVIAQNKQMQKLVYLPSVLWILDLTDVIVSVGETCSSKDKPVSVLTKILIGIITLKASWNQRRCTTDEQYNAGKWPPYSRDTESNCHFNFSAKCKHVTVNTMRLYISPTMFNLHSAEYFLCVCHSCRVWFLPVGPNFILKIGFETQTSILFLFWSECVYKRSVVVIKSPK